MYGIEQDLRGVRCRAGPSLLIPREARKDLVYPELAYETAAIRRGFTYED
jgi:hypothetical protein